MDNSRYSNSHPVVIILLAFCIFALASCSSDEPLPPSPPIVIPPANEPFRADTLLPPPDSIFKASSDIHTIHGMGADSLLGTNARTYLAYHLIGVARRDFDVSGRRLRAEVVQFASTLDAYGYYSQQRPIGVRFSTVNGESFQKDGSAWLTRNQYVFSTQGGNASDSLAVAQLLNAMANRLDIGGVVPLQFLLFPNRDILFPSTKYYATNYLDVAGLDSAYTIDYLIASDTITMFFIPDPDQSNFKRLSDYAERHGADPAPKTIPYGGGNAMVFEHPRRDVDIVFGTVRLYLVGAVNFDEDKHTDFLATWVQGLDN
jgi:hypothetical protein